MAATGSRTERRVISAPDVDVVVVGAGPYGLSVSANLLARGVSTLTFGRPMSFWAEHMPQGMWLRSAWGASSFSDPHGKLTLDAYEAEQPEPFAKPLPSEEFVRYGQWFQERAVPGLDERLIVSVERENGRFAVALDGGERLIAKRVVIATGLRSFPQRPTVFDGLEEPLVTHAMNLTDPSAYRGHSVAMIGSGQSAVEVAALLQEAGANVELIARAPFIRWLARGEKLRGITPLLRKVLYAPTDVGPAGLSWVMAAPNLFKRLPIEPRERLAYRSIRPAATGWLIDRTEAVTMSFDRQVTAASESAGGDGVQLKLDDGSERHVDRVVLGTGYKIDVGQHPLIRASTGEQLRLTAGYPLLTSGMESSIPGLHFVGAYSARSFGPIMRFVSGTWFTGSALSRHLGR